MFNLRSYQTDLISRIAADFSSGIQRVCAVAPCGAGKTVVVGWMAGKRHWLINGYCSWFTAGNSSTSLTALLQQ